MIQLPSRRLGVPAVAIVVAVAIGGAVGWSAGQRSADDGTTAAAPHPIAAVSPSVPVFRPYSRDIDYPPLKTHLALVTRTIGQPPYQWKYAVPKGWISSDLGINEVRWEPAGEPDGGYFLRVKLISSHLTPPQMAQQKYAALNGCCLDVIPIQQQWDTLGVTYRAPGTNTKRWDIFRWLTAAGSDEAEFEMSVGGRGVDDPGLQSLLTNVSASVGKVS